MFSKITGGGLLLSTAIALAASTPASAGWLDKLGRDINQSFIKGSHDVNNGVVHLGHDFERNPAKYLAPVAVGVCAATRGRCGFGF